MANPINPNGYRALRSATHNSRNSSSVSTLVSFSIMHFYLPQNFSRLPDVIISLFLFFQSLANIFFQVQPREPSISWHRSCEIWREKGRIVIDNPVSLSFDNSNISRSPCNAFFAIWNYQRLIRHGKWSHFEINLPLFPRLKLHMCTFLNDMTEAKSNDINITAVASTS